MRSIGGHPGGHDDHARNARDAGPEAADPRHDVPGPTVSRGAVAASSCPAAVAVATIA